MSEKITLRYESIDGVSKTRSFKTIAGAFKFASDYVGEYPTLGRFYAVADDGVGKITVVSGATIREIFPNVDR